MSDKDSNRWRFCAKMAFKADTKAQFNFVARVDEEEDITEQDLVKDGREVNVFVYRE